MSLASSHNLFNNTSSPLSSTALIDENNTPDHTEALLTKLLGDSADTDRKSMDRSASDYSQSGIHSPYSHAFNDAQSEETTADHASVAAQYTPRTNNSNGYSASATPTSEYGVYPASARSTGSFPEHIQRQYHHPASNHSGSSGGGMAQPTSPSMPLQDGRPNHHNTQIKSDQDVPIDPSIAASSPTYPTHSGGQYSPYPPHSDMQHGYSSHPSGAMYTQPRPDWAGYAGQPQHAMHPGYQVSGAQTPTSAAPAGARPGQVRTPDSSDVFEVEEPKTSKGVANEQQQGHTENSSALDTLPHSFSSSHTHPHYMGLFPSNKESPYHGDGPAYAVAPVPWGHTHGPPVSVKLHNAMREVSCTCLYTSLLFTFSKSR